MGWTETHRRWQAMREIEEMLADAPTTFADVTEIPWRDEYDELFGDRDGLLAALRYRWDLARTTQLDTHAHEHVLDESRQRLERRARGVIRLLDRAAAKSEAGTRVVA